MFGLFYIFYHCSLDCLKSTLKQSYFDARVQTVVVRLISETVRKDRIQLLGSLVLACAFSHVRVDQGTSNGVLPALQVPSILHEYTPFVPECRCNIQTQF